MPTVAIVEGVTIQFFFSDHPPPHFHARFAEHQALIALNSWDVLEGSLPAPKLRAVLDWAKAHEDELVICWKKAVVRQSPGKIG